MSISLSISYNDPERVSDLIPIATHDAFYSCWLPACSQLELKWIPLFRTGYPAINLDLETLPEVIDELQCLMAYLAENEDQLDSQCVAQLIIERIERLLLEMRSAINSWDDIEYISV